MLMFANSEREISSVSCHLFDYVFFLRRKMLASKKNLSL